MTDSQDSEGYLVAINHAVWCSQAGELIDVTPFHLDENQHPLIWDEKVIFVVDDNAQPAFLDKKIVIVRLPLPSQFWPMGGNPELLQHVDQQKEEELQRWRLQYRNIRSVA